MGIKVYEHPDLEDHDDLGLATQGELNTEAAARAAADLLLIPLAQKGAANGVATLGADSKIPTVQLPALAVSNTFTVASQAAMLALAAQEGDVAIRSDTGITYILAAEPATVLGNWVQIIGPYEPQGAVATHAALTGNGSHIPGAGISDANVAAGAGIAYSKLSLAGAVLESDLAFTVADQAEFDLHTNATTNVHGIVDTADLILEGDPRLSDSRPPNGAAGGVLSGTFPNPGFAVDMATQAELDAKLSRISTYTPAAGYGFTSQLTGAEATKGHFGAIFTSAEFSGIYDPVMQLGYNVDAPKIAGEPQLFLQWEGHFHNGPADDKMEFFLEYRNADASAIKRIWSGAVDRASHVSRWDINSDAFYYKPDDAYQMVLWKDGEIVVTKKAGAGGIWQLFQDSDNTDAIGIGLNVLTEADTVLRAWNSSGVEKFTLYRDGGLVSRNYLSAFNGNANQVFVGAVAPGTFGPGILLGNAEDTNLYRAAANVLKTDDNLAVASRVAIGADSFPDSSRMLWIKSDSDANRGIRLENTSTGGSASTGMEWYGANSAGDASSTFKGQILYFGPGSGAVIDGVALANAFLFQSEADSFWLYNGGNKPIHFFTNGLNRMTIEGDGDVLVNDSELELVTASKGIILKSPSGTRYRTTVTDLGVLLTVPA